MRTRFSRAVLAAMVIFGLVGTTVATAAPASAGTADYQYTCVTVGQQSWAMPKGTPFSSCAGGMVYQRLNGKVTHIYNVSISGTVYQAMPAGKALLCVITLSAVAAEVIFTDGTVGVVAKRLVEISRGCKA